MATEDLGPRNPLSELIVRRITSGTIWHHIFLSHHPNPLGYGFTASRFSDPRRAKHRFGVYYVGETFEVAFLETLIRDTRNYNPGKLLISRAEVSRYVHVVITVHEEFKVVDLRAGNPITMGIPTDAVRARAHAHAHGRKLSVAVYRHRDRPDGLCYPSRLNQDNNLAVYDRAIHKLIAGPRRSLDQCPELATVLDRYQIAIV
jgi:hypothetical protein